MNGPSGTEEPIGSVGEEAAKLFAALSGWAQEHQSGAGGGDPAAGGAGGGGAAASIAGLFEEVNEHIATGGAECRYCPICLAISFVRETSPEVKAHLAAAAGSFMQAAAGFMAGQAPPEPHQPVQRIDLDEPDAPAPNEP